MLPRRLNGRKCLTESIPRTRFTVSAATSGPSVPHGDLSSSGTAQRTGAPSGAPVVAADCCTGLLVSLTGGEVADADAGLVGPSGTTDLLPRGAGVATQIPSRSDTDAGRRAGLPRWAVAAGAALHTDVIDAEERAVGRRAGLRDDRRGRGRGR